jgi:hypothetical protein
MLSCRRTRRYGRPWPAWRAAQECTFGSPLAVRASVPGPLGVLHPASWSLPAGLSVRLEGPQKLSGSNGVAGAVAGATVLGSSGALFEMLSGADLLWIYLRILLGVLWILPMISEY